MIVANTSIFMGSDHRLEEKDSRTETLRIWVDPPPVESSADKVTLSPQAKEASLSADGSDETLPFLQGGSGFLALDAKTATAGSTAAASCSVPLPAVVLPSWQNTMETKTAG